MVPVSLRQAGDVESGNAIAAISADLATNIADPARRMRAIIASVRAGKAFYAGMSPREIELVSTLLQSPTLLLLPLGLMSKAPPYNVAISNVPGIRETMYWNGARMDGSYPVSIVTDGLAMNITLVTYDQNVDFGIVACRRSVPQVQRFIDYMENALQALEDAAGLSSGAGQKTVQRQKRPKAATTKKSTPQKTSAKKSPAKKSKVATKAKQSPAAARSKPAPKRKAVTPKRAVRPKTAGSSPKNTP